MDKIKLILILFIINISKSKASHLLGGQWSYSYIETLPNGSNKYAIQLDTYIDCSSQSEIPYPEQPLSFGIYENISSEFKPLISTRILNLKNFNQTPINLPPGCILGFDLCLTQASYVDTIILPQSNFGYILFYERCCRSSQIISLNNASQQSESFIATIPPSVIKNSTPQAISQPLPLICLGDTLKLNNYSIDPDGDIIIYNWAHPYSGFGSPNNTSPNLPNPLAYEPPLISYTQGFNSTAPLGINNFTYLNSQNGFIEISTLLQGSFILAYDAIEYRNNIEINRNRREFQITSTLCPQNQSPIISINPQHITINEEEKACFEISISDLDSINWSYSGTIFDSISYTIDTIYHSSNSYKLQVCFLTTCNNFNPELYWGFINVEDFGCVPKSNIENFSLKIDSNNINLQLNLPDKLCINDSLHVYPNVHTGLFNWNVSNAISLNSSYDNFQNLYFNSTGIVNINLNWSGNCNSDTINSQIFISPSPTLDIIGEDTVCYNEMYIYTYNSVDSIKSISWYFNNNFLSTDETINLSFELPGWLILESNDTNYCNFRDSLYIYIHPIPSKLPSDTFICYNKNILILLDSNYSWNILNPYNSNNINNNSWDLYPDSTYTYNYSVSDFNNCSFDSSFTISVNYKPMSNIDTTLCPNSKVIIYNSNSNLTNCTFNPPPISLSSCKATYVIPSSTNIDIIWEYDKICFDTIKYQVTVVDIPTPTNIINAVDTNCIGISYEFINIDSLQFDSTLWFFNQTVINNGNSEFTINYNQNTSIKQETWLNSCFIDTIIPIETPKLTTILDINIPNIITPNNDNINDNWEHNLPKDFENCTRLEIRNRWGGLIYSSNKINFHPNNISPGVYFLLMMIGEDNYTSTITIIKE